MDKQDRNICAPSAYPLNQIYFYLTEGCNLRCRHCWIEPGYQGDKNSYPYLGLETFKSIIRQAKPMGLLGVKLTGGEPLLHPYIQEIMEFLCEEEINLNMETNGVLCNQEISKKIATCKSAFVAVSLDGADAETHEWVRGVKGCFEHSIIGIRNLAQAGLRPQVIMTIMQRNRDQIEELVDLADSLGAGSVKFNIVQPTARGEKMHQSGETLGLEDLIDLGKWIELELSSSVGIPLHYSHPPAFRSLGKIYGDDGDGCQVCGILGIIGVLSSGAYALCGIGQTVPELVFGHASTDRLADIWNNSSILKEIREGLPDRFEGICGRCLMKGMCFGNCLAQNFYSSGNFWSPYWYCHIAFKKGLFPETRLRP